jgi:RNA polymerase sigma factor (TIGR02999 family)
VADGDQDAAARLVPLVYEELRRIAAHRLRHERPGHTLQATALVNEAYLRLVGQTARWQNRAQFFGVASQLMRRILVDYARTQKRIRRGGKKQRRVSLDEILLIAPDRTDELLDVHELLSRLEKLDARQGRIVELRYFGGLTLEEAAEVLGVSVKTVMRDWTIVKAWLYGELKECHGDDARRMEQGKGAV